MVGQRRSLAQGPIPSDPLTSPVPTSCAAGSSLRIDVLEQLHDGPYSCDLPKEPGDLVPLGEGLSTVADTDHVPMAAFLAVPRGSAPCGDDDVWGSTFFCPWCHNVFVLLVGVA